MKQIHQIEQTNHSSFETASNNNKMISLIPSDIKEKLTPNSTYTLVYVMYLQWAYMVTLMVILNLLHCSTFGVKGVEEEE